MKYLKYCLLICFLLHEANSVRLHKLFQFIDGYKSEHDLKGFLHVGVDYAVFLRKPQPHDKFLTYELYESRNVPDIENYRPKMLAITQVPVEYIKEQLKMFRTELYQAKYINDKVVPGTQVRTLREWQLDQSLKNKDRGVFDSEMKFLRARV